MGKHTHVNITIDFTNWNDDLYDLRIPIHLTVKQLLLILHETLEIPMPNHPLFALKIITKQLLIADDDHLVDFPITNGDVIVVL